MRAFSTILWSSSAMAFALCATSAAAQVQPATPPDTTVQAQEQPADPDAGSPQTDDAVQTAAGADQGDGTAIVVTGLRRSLQSAQNIKRNSEQIVDAIVAEDIGKLPDTAVSDTAARIPGFQVERERGEGGRVLLRGLDENYYTTTYNGREIFTAERRQVALQDFPAGGIAAIEAFKTSSANLVEPGLTGLVNVRSRRPFDFSGFELAGSVWGVYPNQSRDFKPNAQLLVSNRWDLGEGDVGVLLNASLTQLHYQDSIRRHGFFVANLAGGRSPDWPEIRYNEGNRKRPSINGALQWRNGSGLELYAEGLWQAYRDNLTDRMWAQPLWGGSSYSNLVFRDGTNQILSGTVTNPGAPGETWGFQGATKRRTDTYQFAVGGSYDAGPLKITADLARSNSKFNLRTESIDYELNTNQYTVNWYTGRPGGSGPTLEVVGIDPSDPSIYNYRGFFEDYLTAKGKDVQGRLDFEYEPAGIDFLKNFQWGARYVDRDASRRAGNRYWNNTLRGCCGGPHPLTPLSVVPLDYQLFNSAFHGDNNRPFPNTWLAPTFNSVWDNLTAFRQFNVDLLGQHSTDDPANDPGRSFDINEKSLAGYGQLNYRFDTGSDMSVDGQLGVRVVRTKDKVEGTLFNPGDPPTPLTVNNKYTDWLPNASANLRFSPNWALRLAASKTRLRPQFEQLNPALSLGAPPGCAPGTSNCVRTGSGGNPFLKPLKSTNYDASLEYYFSRTGFASLAAFRRDMKGFIVNRTFTYGIPDPETGLPLEITGPTNANKGRIQGFEAQVSTFFDWDWMPTWARGFGAQANVTYLDPKIDLRVAGADRTVRIPDVSKWTFNLVAMYEANGLTARLAYNRRSSYPEGAIADDAVSGNGFTRQGRGNPVSRLDWSSSYTLTDNVTLFLDWTNILKKPFKSDIVWSNYSGSDLTSREIFPMVVRYEESVVSGGIRFRFGGPRRAAAEPVVALPPPPPPPVEPAPVVEQPAPPPPPAVTPERG
jgi:TonB-dependent receptor